MIYFLLGVALTAWLDPEARALIRRPALWIALAIAAIVVAPNIIWNVEHGFATFRHTGDNIQGGGIAFSPAKGLEFVAAQFAVFGPVVFAVLLYAIVRIGSPATSRADRMMLAFALPPLVLVTGTGFVTRALANWAAPAFISAVVVVTAIMVRRGAWKWIALSLAIGVAVQAALMAGDALATRLNVPGLGDLYRRTLGWRALGEHAGQLAHRAGARTIVVEARDDVASLLYYWRDQPEQVLAWPRGTAPDHQFDITRAFTSAAPMPALFVSRCAATERLSAQFASVEPLGSFDAPTGPTSARTYFAFRLNAPRGAILPLGAC
jgi:hypothetical protein